MASLGRRCVALLVVSLLVVAGGCSSDAGSAGPGGAGGSGAPPDAELEREIFGLVGRVIAPNEALAPGGTVYLVPAADVAELAAEPINLFLSPEDTEVYPFDEPIEDLIDARGDTYAQAMVGADGEYRFETLPEGSHFVTWIPSVGDETHLPGGDYCRVAFSTDSLTGMQMDIRLSSRPSANATYVGSSTCMACHGLQSTTRTAHNVGLQVPGVRSDLQDIEPWPDFDEGLAAFGASTDLYYFNCSPSPSTHEDPSNCDVSESNPGPGAFDFRIELRRESSKPLGAIGAYYIDMINGTTERYEVVLTYGGALEKQQYLARRENMDGSFSYFVLPLQYNYQGDDSDPDSDPEDWPWRDYRSDLWYDLGADALRQPDDADSFDNNCAGCHFTGYRLAGSDTAGWAARAAQDPDGAFDYDGDGNLELINTGCEACHGPGSEHVDDRGGGPIISPASLTPGRETAICGSCHSRPVGIGAGGTGLPLSADNEMPPVGIRRADFAREHTTRVSGTEDDFFNSGDPKAHYQQYSDHIRSTHYRNPIRISTCTGCHNPHARFEDVYSMDTSGNVNALCTVCHSPGTGFPPLEVHIEETVGYDHGFVMESEIFLCTSCHMVPTAKSGASVPALLDTFAPPEEPFRYYWNDITNHRLNVTRRERAAEQPVAATSDCASCHGTFLPADQ